ncbi:MAG: DNA/RNA non-specific endonuclease [Clostridiales bacterium]|nr:DNA/RNA non-specific endonuclease [Clostridiales bacterium]
MPDNNFEVDGFHYETDSNGRTKSVEGQLQKAVSSKRSMDSMDVVGKGDNLDGDEKGHLIAHRFGGSDKLENLVAMDEKLNRGDYARMENELAKAVDAGADVRMKVEPEYKGDSNRPSEIRVTYSIDGDTSVRVFRNGGDD